MMTCVNCTRTRVSGKRSCHHCGSVLCESCFLFNPYCNDCQKKRNDEWQRMIERQHESDSDCGTQQGLTLAATFPAPSRSAAGI